MLVFFHRQISIRLDDTPSTTRSQGIIIEKHHENWNGTGYPNKLEGENIPIESQIILIVDCYCALLEKRPYRSAKSKEEALDIIMSDSNSKWSAKLATEFEKMIKEDVI